MKDTKGLSSRKKPFTYEIGKPFDILADVGYSTEVNE